MGLDLLKGDDFFRYGSYSYVWVLRAQLIKALVPDAIDEEVSSLANVDFNTYKDITNKVKKYDPVLYRFVDHSDAEGITSLNDAIILSRLFKHNMHKFDDKTTREWVEEFCEFVDNSEDGDIMYV